MEAASLRQFLFLLLLLLPVPRTFQLAPVQTVSLVPVLVDRTAWDSELRDVVVKDKLRLDRVSSCPRNVHCHVHVSRSRIECAASCHVDPACVAYAFVSSGQTCEKAPRVHRWSVVSDGDEGGISVSVKPDTITGKGERESGCEKKNEIYIKLIWNH